MPEATLDAFRDHGRVRPDAVLDRLEAAVAHMALLPEHGIDFDQVTARLLDDGLAAFDADLTKLLAAIEAKLAAAQPPRRIHTLRGPRPFESGWRNASMTPNGPIRRADLAPGPHRLEPGPTEIADRLGWLDLPETMADRIAELRAFAARGAARTASPTPSWPAWGDRACRPTCSGGCSEWNPARSTSRCSTPPTPTRSLPWSARSTSHGPCSSRPPSRGARSRRSPTSTTSTHGPRAAVSSWRSPIRGRRSKPSAGAAASARSSSTPLMSAAATPRCRSSGSCPRRSSVSTSTSSSSRRRRWPPPAIAACHATGTPAFGWGP